MLLITLKGLRMYNQSVVQIGFGEVVNHNKETFPVEVKVLYTN